MKDKVVILLSTYNEEKYLLQQMDSLFTQTYKNFQIIARDDGSSDNTFELLSSFNIKIIDSKENLGAKDSFVTLLNYALKYTDSKYFMFCDQDDVWDIDKVEQTMLKMQEIEKDCLDIPALVHTDLRVVDEDLNILHKSFMSYQKIDAKYNSLNNLLIQNTIAGCTMMLNRKLAILCLPIVTQSFMHDWWIGLVASQFGKIGYLNQSTISYRQHTKNSVGAKKFSLKYILHNIDNNNILLKNILQAKAFLDRFKDMLDDNTVEMLEEFSTLESKSFWKKRKILLEYKLLKQGFIRNIGLMVKI